MTYVTLRAVAVDCRGQLPDMFEYPRGGDCGRRDGNCERYARFA